MRSARQVSADLPRHVSSWTPAAYEQSMGFHEKVKEREGGGGAEAGGTGGAQLVVGCACGASHAPADAEDHLPPPEQSGQEEKEEEEEEEASQNFFLSWPRSSSTTSVAHSLCWFSW